MNSRELFLNACSGNAVTRPPVWLMRQAGRSLPEYRKLKEKHTFIEMVQSPDLATEVTLQPLRRFPLDAAILFSDILVVPEALGQPYSFTDGNGIRMEFTIGNKQDIERLETKGLRERLAYTREALRQIKRELDGQQALLGFAGSPWTLANYMIGGNSQDTMLARRLYHEDPALFECLMEKLTDAVADYLEMQIEAGADAVQIFDSMGGCLPPTYYNQASGKWIGEIISRLAGKAPVIVFAKGTLGSFGHLVEIGAQFLSMDWTVDLGEIRNRIPEQMGLQGNLDPAVLTSTPEVAANETKRILESMRGFHRYIFNLGHGVTKDAKLESIEAVVTTVRDFQ
ncbi:MAG: uroporphyrinogen decarboxylase [Verrucomicrobia bacterium]|nr:uroporphyrinogen decarboxylase [Verrucomicrobiota bacterium]MBT7734111.1 uroporphyrinogen decarboxylase [Verrucomicrobiota bacterium]